MKIYKQKNPDLEVIANLLKYNNRLLQDPDCETDIESLKNNIKALCNYYRYGCVNINETLTQVRFMMPIDNEFYIMVITLTDTPEQWQITYSKLS